MLNNIHQKYYIPVILGVCLLHLFAATLAYVLTSDVKSYDLHVVLSGYGVMAAQILFLYFVFVFANRVASGKQPATKYIFLITTSILLPLLVIRLFAILAFVFVKSVSSTDLFHDFNHWLAIILLIGVAMITILFFLFLIVHLAKQLSRLDGYKMTKSVFVIVLTFAIYLAANYFLIDVLKLVAVGSFNVLKI